MFGRKQARLQLLEEELATMRRMNKRVRDVHQTTGIAMNNMRKLNQRMIELMIEIKKLRNKA